MNKMIFLSLFYSSLFCESLSIMSYNCGGIEHHYDYQRAACMQKLMRQREKKEPMALAFAAFGETVQLQALFDPTCPLKYGDGATSSFYHDPTQPSSFHHQWYKQASTMISHYQDPHVIIYDKEVFHNILNHCQKVMLDHNLPIKGLTFEEKIGACRSIMAKDFFRRNSSYDIIALQEADDFIQNKSIPKEYEVLAASQTHSINALCFKKERFTLIRKTYIKEGQGIVAHLFDKTTQKTITIASAHLTGCNPYVKGPDSEKGDKQLKALISYLEKDDGNIKVIAMDSNVTAVHPRLKIVKDHHFILDYKNYIYPTCTSPYYCVDTRLDWIAVYDNKSCKRIENRKIEHCRLNAIEENFSDHAPVGADIEL